MVDTEAPCTKPIVWMGDSKDALSAFPEPVRTEIGYALYQGQLGQKHPSMKVMKGMPSVEIVSDFDGDTFRSVYTTKFKGEIYVLHCFKKKSKKGIATPKRELDLIKKRLQDADKINRQRQKEADKTDPNSTV